MRYCLQRAWAALPTWPAACHLFLRLPVLMNCGFPQQTFLHAPGILTSWSRHCTFGFMLTDVFRAVSRTYLRHCHFATFLPGLQGLLLTSRLKCLPSSNSPSACLKTSTSWMMLTLSSFQSSLTVVVLLSESWMTGFEDTHTHISLKEQASQELPSQRKD